MTSPAAVAPPVIEVRGLRKSFGSLKVLTGEVWTALAWMLAILVVAWAAAIAVHRRKIG